MCGITGAFAISKLMNEPLPRLKEANEVLNKRGPNGGATYWHKRVSLGHRRLSIIDTSCAGDQPMHSLDGKFTVVFNGEILNFKELKEKYLSQEEIAKLRSNSDTEVFLQIYTNLKEKTFSLLRGFFAAAIYDHDAEELVLVRDRFGKKPLLYYKDENQFVFASEMKALFEVGIPRQVNWDVLPVYFKLNYIPQPNSLVKGVQKIKPGYYLKVNASGISEGCFYKLNTYKESYSDFSYETAKSKLVNLMDEAVKLRMISDVPLGSFLSGGIDSSVVVALASKHTDKLSTFSIGYKDHPFFDETYYANLVAKKFNTDHTVFSLTNNDFLEHVHNVLDYIDEPFADSSAIPEYILSYYTRKHVTVALSGDGGDEVFAGYNKHAAEWRMRKGGLLKSLVKAGHPVWKILPKNRNHKLTNIFRQLERFSSGAKMSPANRYWQWAGFVKDGEVSSLFSDQTSSKINKGIAGQIQDEFTSAIKGDDFNEVLLADMNLVLLSDMLVKVDLMSMANSLEIRSPFLDQEVVEFAFGLPSEYKIDHKLKKKIVQDAFRDMLPAELYNRPKKGFEIPLLNWFRNELWGLINDDLLNDMFIKEQGIFDLNTIQQLKKRLHSNNPGDSHATIWALLVFQWWLRKYEIEG